MCIVQFQFLLPSSHPNRMPHNKASSALLLSHVPSLDEMALIGEVPLQLDDCQRTGIMLSFTKMEEFENYFDDLMDLFLNNSRPDSPSGGDDDMSKGGISCSISSSFSDMGININDYDLKPSEPIHILNVSLKLEGEVEDNILSERFGGFVIKNRDILLERGIRRVTVIVLNRRQFPKYFTYRVSFK